MSAGGSGVDLCEEGTLVAQWAASARHQVASAVKSTDLRSGLALGGGLKGPVRGAEFGPIAHQRRWGFCCRDAELREEAVILLIQC